MKKACLWGLIALLLVTGCLLNLPAPFSPAPPPTKRIIVRTAQVYTTETPAACTDQPTGVAIMVTPLSATQVQVEAQGMQPGEQLIFQYIGRPSPQSARRYTEWTRDGVKADGAYTATQGGLIPATGSTINAWTIKVIHARGVACQEIVLPMP